MGIHFGSQAEWDKLGATGKIYPDRKIKKKNGKKKSKKVVSRKKWFVTTEGKDVKASPMERLVAKTLRKMGVKYEREVSFKGLNPSKTEKGYLRFDFFIPEKRVAIEYDGAKWHESKDAKRRDHLKNEYCRKHNIKLLRLTKVDLPKMEERILEILK